MCSRRIAVSHATATVSSVSEPATAKTGQHAAREGHGLAAQAPGGGDAAEEFSRHEDLP
jgi:hypothetical protein